MGLCADRLRGGSAVSDYVLGWLGDPRRQSDNVPLRLAGARHAWRIEGLALEGVYPSQEGEDEALWAAVEPTLLRFPKRIVLSLQSAPQTNEVLRAAVILPALALIEERFGRPLDLFELGQVEGLTSMPISSIDRFRGLRLAIQMRLCGFTRTGVDRFRRRGFRPLSRGERLI